MAIVQVPSCRQTLRRVLSPLKNQDRRPGFVYSSSTQCPRQGGFDRRLLRICSQTPWAMLETAAVVKHHPRSTLPRPTSVLAEYLMDLPYQQDNARSEH